MSSMTVKTLSSLLAVTLLVGLTSAKALRKPQAPQADYLPEAPEQKRFEYGFDKRFDTFDKRFDTFDKRFDTMDKRFDMDHFQQKRFDLDDFNYAKRFDYGGARFGGYGGARFL